MPSGWCIVGGTHTVEDWTECTPIHLSGRNDVLFAKKCIRLVCEKLAIFPYGQDIVGNVVLLAFRQYSQIQDWSGVLGEMYKNVTVISRKMDLAQHTMQRWRHVDHRPVYSLFVDWVCTVKHTKVKIVYPPVHLADITRYCTAKWYASS